MYASTYVAGRLAGNPALFSCQRHEPGTEQPVAKTQTRTQYCSEARFLARSSTRSRRFYVARHQVSSRRAAGSCSRRLVTWFVRRASSRACWMFAQLSLAPQRPSRAERRITTRLLNPPTGPDCLRSRHLIAAAQRSTGVRPGRRLC